MPLWAGEVRKACIQCVRCQVVDIALARFTMKLSPPVEDGPVTSCNCEYMNRQPGLEHEKLEPEDSIEFEVDHLTLV